MPPGGVDAGPDARPPTPPGSTVYRGIMTSIPAVTFGGQGATEWCTYTIELRQVELELTVSTTGQITGGTSQALAVETRLATPTPPGCTAGPGIPPNIHKFTFRSATPSGNNTMIVMDGAIANEPRTGLTVTLSPSAGAFSAASRWMRTGGVNDPVLTWTVNANLTLTVRP